MTDEELIRFALQLREADRVRAQIAREEAAARADGGGELPALGALQAVERPSSPVEVAAA